MRLTVAEAETLNYYMAGLGFVEIAQMQNVNNTTVWRRRNSRGLLNFLPPKSPKPLDISRLFM